MNCSRTCNGRLPASASQIQLPPCPMYLDAMIGAQDFVGGTVPKIGEYHIRVVSIDGFPQESHAELLEGLDTLPIPYRWSTRFIYLDSWEADAELEKYRRNGNSAKRPIRDQIFGTKDGKIDLDALSMEEDVVAARQTPRPAWCATVITRPRSSSWTRMIGSRWITRSGSRP